MKYEKEIKFIPTRFGLDCKFYLKGEKGIIQFCIDTGWNENTNDDHICRAYAFDVGYHSPIPLYEDQKPMPNCQFYTPCYYDGSSLYAKDLFDRLIKEGEKAVWDELQKAYRNWLEKEVD
jgi:hypothetical protein